MTSLRITEDYYQYQQYLITSIDKWKSDSACKSAFQEVDFFSTKESELFKLAKTYCFNCKVQSYCLYTSLVTQEIHGLWGALTPKQRKFYLKHILSLAAEQGISTKIWSEELNEVFKEYSTFEKIQEYFSLQS